MKTKYQTIEKRLSYNDVKQLNHGSDCYGAIKQFDINIDDNTDRRFNRCADIFMYTSADWSDNLNGEVVQPLLIDHDEVFPIGFDTFLCFPMVQNQQFTHLAEPVSVDKSKIEGRVRFTLEVPTEQWVENNGATTPFFTLKITLKLERTTPKFDRE